MIESQSKLANRKSRNKNKNITSINRNKDTTYKLNAKTFRLTENDIKKLEKLARDNSTKKNHASGAKIIRALINYAYDEDIDIKKYIPL